MTVPVRVAAMFVVPLLVVASPVDSRGQAAEAVGELTGVVLTADEPARPIRQAVVTLIAEGAGASGGGWWERTVGDLPATLTDDDGRFRFARIPAGRYRVKAAKPPFLAMEFGARRPGDPGTGVTLVDGAGATDLSIRLMRGAVIAGVVRNPDGSPAVNVGVAAASRAAGGVRLTAATDDRGVYRFFGLPAGEYLISSWLVSSFSPGEQSTRVSVKEVDDTLATLGRRFAAIGAAAPGVTTTQTRSAATVGTPALRPLQVAPTFYPGTIDQTRATPITVTPAQVSEGNDFQLTIAGTVDLAGIVRLPNGDPAAGAIVSIAVGRTSATAADGTFRIGGVAPGQHTLSARVTALSTAIAGGQSADAAVLRNANASGVVLWASEDVHVPDTGIAGLIVTLQPGKTLSGRVAFDATVLPAPTDFSSVKIRLTGNGVTASPEIRPDGSFDIRGMIPGTAEIAGTVGGAGLPGWWLRSALLGGRDVLDLPLEITGSTGDVSGLVLTFSDRHTEVSGTLETPAGLPATSCVVAILPSDRRLWHPRSRRLAFTRPATDGQFAFRDLPAGDYVIVALTDLETETWRTTSFLDSIAGAGVKVTLPEGGRVVQRLRID